LQHEERDIHKLPEWVARVWVHGRSSLLVASASGVLPQAPSSVLDEEILDEPGNQTSNFACVDARQSLWVQHEFGVFLQLLVSVPL
jgi:hypothetical protein